MNKKTLLSIMLPATQKNYDFWVPTTMPLREVSNLVAGILESQEQDYFHATPNTTLMLQESGELLDPYRSVQETGLINGSCLVLV